jgi:hypothetical protein
MNPLRDDGQIDDKMKRLLANPPAVKLSEGKRREFIARLYKVSEERKSVIELIRAVNLRPMAEVAVMLLVTVLSAHYLLVPNYPVISDVKGTVKVYRAASNEWSFVEGKNIRLYMEDALKTFGDGEANIVSAGAYHIRVKADTEIKLASAPARLFRGDIRYELAKGRAFSHYSKNRTIGKELKIDTSQAEATCLGTDFMVDVSPLLNKTWVGVLDGLVKVEGKGLEGERLTSVLVKPGQKTVVFKDMAPAKPTRLMETELLEMEELYQIGTRPQVALLISTGPTRTRELLSVTPLYISAEKAGTLPNSIRRAADQFSQAIKEGSKERHLESIKEFEDLVNKHPNPKYDVQFLLFLGAYYEYLDEHIKAIETFQRVIARYPNSSLASIAQCAIGIIYEEKLNEPELAKAAYRAVIAQYPRSAEVEEAIAGLGRLSR